MAKSATAVRGRARAAVDADRTVKELTKVFKSLSDEHRLKILFLLARNGEMHVAAIGEELGQSQPAVSHHLTQLRNAGLIDYRRDGKFNFYDIHSDGVSELLDTVFASGPAKLNLGGVEVSFKSRRS